MYLVSLSTQFDFSDVQDSLSFNVPVFERSVGVMIFENVRTRLRTT